MQAAPSWVDPALYPFTSRWIKFQENSLHYIDEGKGDVLLFVHGTPEWSFGYREVIQELRKDFRCVAIDLLGFGLSDKPPGGDYACVDHAKRLTQFIDALALRNITLVANDFGGGIGLSYAIAHPENISRIVLFNTWMRSLKNDPNFMKPSRIVNSWLGKFLYLTLNFPVKTIMPAAFGDKKKLTKAIHNHYKMALPDSNSRRGTLTLAKELADASDWWQKQWEQLGNVSHKPFLFFWGMKDKFVPPSELDRWKSALPGANYIIFDDAGHFVQEEKPAEMAAAIRSFAK